MKNKELDADSGAESLYVVCKECGDDLPQGKGARHLAARLMGYCRYCYKAHFPERKARGTDTEAFAPEIREPSDSPWEWNESIRMMYDETDRYER